MGSDFGMVPKPNRALCVFSERLKRLRIGGHPGLLFNPWLEGFRDHTFGGRAGPSIGVSNLLHELGHAAQFGPDKFTDRCKPYGFVFRTRQVTVLGRQYPEPLSMQSTDRELETFAFQLHLMRLCGSKVSDAWFFADSASVMRLMPDWWCVPGDGEAERKAFCAQRIAELHHGTSSNTVVDRLEVWLDKTARRLRRKDLDRPYHKVDQRFRVDGSVLG